MRLLSKATSKWWAMLLWMLVSPLSNAEDRYLDVPKGEIELILERGYNLDSSVAGLIDNMIRDYPESPLGLCLKAARLFQLDDYAEGSDDAIAESFEKASTNAIEASERYYQIHPENPEGRYAVAMCELNLARYYIDHGRWFGGFLKARSGLGHLKQLLKEYPDFHDAKMPLGVANCFLDKVPVYLKPIARLLHFSGDMELGLQQLKDAETRGFLTRHESLYYQVAIQWVVLEDKEAAKQVLDRFVERFPRNANALLLRAHLARQLEDFKMASNLYEMILSMPEVDYLKDVRDWVVWYSGNAALHLEDAETALAKAELVLDTVEEDRKELRAWGFTLKGNALVHLGKREEAREAFSFVKKRDNAEAYKAVRETLDEMRQDEISDQ
jgi:predicted negative regulator of RcsB-dependent stress response